MRNLPAILWIIGSAGFLITIPLFIISYQPASSGFEDKAIFTLENWQLISGIWRAETILAIFIALSSLYFAIKTQSLSWITIAFAHILMTAMYAFMLGGYYITMENFNKMPHVLQMLFNIATWIFALSNLLFLTGMAFLYYKNKNLKRWLSNISFAIALLGSILMLLLFLEIVSFTDILFVGPLIMMLYAVNVYYGFIMYKKTASAKMGSFK